MNQDPLDVFFETGRSLVEIEPTHEQQSQPDNPAPMRAIEEQAIAEDVQLVRTKLKSAIEGMAEKVPGLLELAMMMQEPEMVDSAAKMIATLSKVSTDLIGIDLRVLQESKKIKLPPAQPADPARPGEAPEPDMGDMSTSDVIAVIRRDRLEREAQQAKDKATRPTETVDAEVKPAPTET